jgi:trypsin-like peptidase
MPQDVTMSILIIEDSREYIFPIFSVRTQGNSVLLASRLFLGTAFFVTKCGDAITANHVIPEPEALEAGRGIVAVVLQDGEQKVCWITHAAKFESWDMALIHVNLEHTKYFKITIERIPAGTDVQIVGIPHHEVWNAGKEMRVLKGHVTFSGKYLELNFPVPAGMSGSPLLIGTQVAAYVTGSVRSEEIEETTEEVAEISDKREVIRLSEIRRVVYYGLAYPFSHLRTLSDPVLGGKTLFELIRERNTTEGTVVATDPLRKP